MQTLITLLLWEEEERTLLDKTQLYPTRQQPEAEEREGCMGVEQEELAVLEVARAATPRPALQALQPPQI